MNASQQPLHLSGLESARTLHRLGGAVVAFGVFDGVHLGHQGILTHIARRARELGAVPVAIVFRPRPGDVLGLAPLRPYLSSEGETTNRIRALGVEHVAILRFTRKLALCRAKAFLTSLSRRVPMRELWLGPDARVGRGPTGVPDAVAQIGEELGFRTGVFGCGSGAGAGYFPTSGDIEGLNEWLGRRYALTCYVGHPLRRISAELMECEVVTPETLFVPPPGHYAVEGHLPGGSRSAAALMIVREFPETGMPAASLIAHRRLGWAGSHMRIEFLSRWQPEPVDVHCWAVHVVKTQGTADTRNRGRKGR